MPDSYPEAILVPASGAWRPDDDPGDRRFVELGDLHLQSGVTLPDTVIAYESWGRLNSARDNAVFVLHALTGDSHVVGPTGPAHFTPGWWPGLIGPGRALDTDRWYVVAANILGGCQGSTGPASDAPDGMRWGSRFPYLTTRDQVSAEIAWADALGVDRWALVLGGSAGGMRALEWAVTVPERVERLLVLASTPYATADQIGWCAAQLAAIRADPGFRGGDYYDAAPGDGPHRGLGVARRIAHLTYRSASELDVRFGRGHQRPAAPGEPPYFQVQSYLDHHGDKLVGRFDANSYVVLTQAMNNHDVGRDRGGVAAALRRVTARTSVVGIDSDRLYPVELSIELGAEITGASTQVLHSDHGHDGFLVEVDAVAEVVAKLLDT
ncbi:MAG: homoserine O-acetyltransferase MetX [Propionibacteriaceae bacterium]